MSDIFSLSLKHGYIPKAWKQAAVLLIKKPDKVSTNPANYRPISLLSCLGKLLEISINSKLNAWAEQNNKINIEQSGFRNHRSTQDQLFRLTQQISQGFNRKHTTTSVFLDIEKAFDRVWHNGLRHKLLSMDTPPHLLRWISNFLTDRTMKITINEKTSEPIFVNYGVPQGSPLSPLLFLLYVADCPFKNMKHCTATQFADDLSISTTSKNIEKNIKHMQKAIISLSEWCNNWRISISQSKTKLIHFSRGKFTSKQSVTINNSKITVCSETKFLGLTLDRKLLFNKHFSEQQSKASFRLHRLNMIHSGKFGPSQNSMLRLYKCYLRSLFEYGNASTNIASKTTFQKYEKIQRQFATRILRFPSHVSNNTINKHCNLDSIKDRNIYLSKKWYAKTQQPSSNVKQFTNSIIKIFPTIDKQLTPISFCKTN